MTTEKYVQTPTLEIAYEESGPAYGQPVVLVHGFPHSPRSFDRVVPLLVHDGYRVLVPTLRGYGNTRFLKRDTPRSGQQAALGQDLVDFIEALQLPPVLTAGFDWGRRSCVVASILKPQLILGQVLIGGYDVQKIADASVPGLPEQESAMWHGYFFTTERGCQALISQREAYAEFMWRQWNPTQPFDVAEFAANATYFHSPDFVDVVLSSYRHRLGLAPGDPQLEQVEALLALQPQVSVPTSVLISGAEPAIRRGHDETARFFTGPFRYALLEGIGHNLPFEAPKALALELKRLGQQAELQACSNTA